MMLVKDAPINTGNWEEQLLRRPTAHTPSLENRVAYQASTDLDTLGYQNIGNRDRLILRWLREAVQRSTSPTAVLDIGCSHGNMQLMLNANLDKPQHIKFIGIDIFEPALEFGRAFARIVPGYENCSYLAADLEKPLPFESAFFDAVNLGDVLEHLEDPLAAVKEIARVTKPGGTIVIVTPLKDGLFKKIAAFVNALSGGKLYSHYYSGKETELDENNQPIMEVNAGHDHISEMTHKELRSLFQRAGLIVKEEKLGPVMSGSAWFDRHPFLLAWLLGLEAIHGVLRFPSWAHSICVKMEKPR